tara:strand:+ start:307 stop:1989 length:1683 start_codon:yes stop_codon:yes gene_type:complete
MADPVMAPGDITKIIEMQKGFDSMASSVGIVERKMAGLKGAIRGMPFVKMVIGIDNYRKSLKKSLHNMGEWHQLSDKEKKKRKGNMTLLQKILVPMMAYSKIGKRMNKITATSNTLLGRFTARLFGLFAIFLVIGFALAIVSLAFDGMNSPLVNATKETKVLGDAVQGLVFVLTGEGGEGGLAGALDIVAASLVTVAIMLMVVGAPIALTVGAVVLLVGSYRWLMAETDNVVITFWGLVAVVAVLLSGVILFAGYFGSGFISAVVVAIAQFYGITVAALAGVMLAWGLFIGGLVALWMVATGKFSDGVAWIVTIVGVAMLAIGLVIILGLTWPVAIVIALIVGIVALVIRYWDQITAMFTGGGAKARSGLKRGESSVQSAAKAVLGFILTPYKILWKLGGALIRGITGGIRWILETVERTANVFMNTPGSMKTRLIAAFKDLARSVYTKLYDIFSFTIPAFSIAGKQLWGDTLVEILPNIPMLAKGGIVTSPTLAMIGEAGPEAVVPLGKGGGMGNTFNINIDVSGMTDRSDKRAFAMQISDEIQKEMRRYGRGTTRRGY